MEYFNLDLHIRSSQSSQTYTIEAHSPLGGDAQEDVNPDVQQWENTLADVTKTDASTHAVVTAGKLLFRALFPGRVEQCYVVSRSKLQDNQGLRIRLHFSDSALAALPWELLYDDNLADDFLALSLRSPVLRYLDNPIPITPLKIDGPIRMLLATAAPQDLRPLSIEEERDYILEALRPLCDEKLVIVECLHNTTKRTLQDQLRQGYHIFHFIGHGVPSGKNLCLENDHRQTDHLTALDLGRLLAGTPVRLALLNACQSAVPERTPNWSLGLRLARVGIPAVVGMRGAILDKAAVTFAREFYEAIASGNPVEAAITEGRKAVMSSAGGYCQDWSLPVLYMRSQEGRLFDPQNISSQQQYIQMNIALR